jgi:hypothetical protein
VIATLARNHERTETEGFTESLEHLDKRDAVNAILGRIGRQLTDETYEAIGPGWPDEPAAQVRRPSRR